MFNKPLHQVTIIVALAVIICLPRISLPVLHSSGYEQLLSHAELSHPSTIGLYWFQVGAWAESASGYGHRFGEPVTGASVEIRILSDQVLTHADTDLSYWVGVNLPNDAFIQVGYGAAQDHNLGKPSWFWEYFPPGTAREASVGFLGKIGSVVGPNGTWVKFSIAATETVWSAYVGEELVGSIDLKISDAGTNGPYASAEVAGTNFVDNVLGPVEFRNLSYRDTNSVWHKASAGVALCCYGSGSDKLGSGEHPYGVTGITGDDNHWIAGSGLPDLDEGEHLWPWYYVTVSSQHGSASGTGWYVKGTRVYPSAATEITISQGERLIWEGWAENGVTSTSSYFTVDYNMNLVAVYAKQYLITITSPFGSVYGSGWYDAGSNATIWVSPTFISDEGWLGQLGAGTVFARWEGDFTGAQGKDAKTSFTVDASKSIHAVWSKDYGLVPALVVVIAVVAAVIVLLVHKRTSSSGAHRRTMSLAEPRSISLTMYCRFCGAKVPRDSDFCVECGRNLSLPA